MICGAVFFLVFGLIRLRSTENNRGCPEDWVV